METQVVDGASTRQTFTVEKRDNSSGMIKVSLINFSAN